MANFWYQNYKRWAQTFRSFLCDCSRFARSGIVIFSFRKVHQNECMRNEEEKWKKKSNIASIYYPLGILNKPKTPCAYDGAKNERENWKRWEFMRAKIIFNMKIIRAFREAMCYISVQRILTGINELWWPHRFALPNGFGLEIGTHTWFFDIAKHQKYHMPIQIHVHILIA